MATESRKQWDFRKWFNWQDKPKSMKWDEIKKEIASTKWTWAKTYENFAPHEYIHVKTNEPLFYNICKIVDDLGVWEEYRIYTTVKEFQYLYIDDYKYWHYEQILNRARIDEYPDGKPKDI